MEKLVRYNTLRTYVDVDCATKGLTPNGLNGCDKIPPTYLVRHKAAATKGRRKKYEKGEIYQQVSDDFFSFYMGIASCIRILAWNPLRCTYL